MWNILNIIQAVAVSLPLILGPTSLSNHTQSEKTYGTHRIQERAASTH